ncbi:NAD(P)H-hydrate dehydratase [Cypionkella sinensis]|uniref:Bifunctional NAD(P)H-hydrate repair enzyme n=1 Tax=Cypionkella sinensis TaxID=1756043 RepID=A0ABV7J008_9RHOB
MSEVLTAAQMRAIEAAAIASGAVTGLELMERAGAGVVAAVLEEWPEMALTSQRAVVLCGPGNNGGDGFVVARLLAARGWAVEVYLYGDAGKLPPDARVNYERWCEVGEVKRFLMRGFWPPNAEVVVDALFGIGLKRPIPADTRAAFSYQQKTSGTERRVAIDMPSGLCSDSGRPLGLSGKAALTVTFHRAKVGQFLASGPSMCGKIVVVDIGLPIATLSPIIKVMGHVNEAHHVQQALQVYATDLERQRAQKSVSIHLTAINGNDLFKRADGAEEHARPANKFSHGHALIVSGDHGHAGAARMAARGALRIGAGLVTVASPLGAMAENAARLDAVMLRPVADAAGLAEVLSDMRINALCIGPGLGVARAAELLAVVLRGGVEPRPTVLDADALTALAQDRGLFALLHDRCVLTPHGGEFARLFPDIAANLAEPAMKGPAYSKVDATREAAKRAGCVVLYKGADTVIADPTGRCAINTAVYDRAAPWLATAGSGDVLAGFITGLMARGFDPMQAAETAAWLHVECARSFGPGLIAEDLPEELPKVFRALGV